MDYQNFLSAVERGMNERLSEDITVRIHTTVKNNGLKKQGITIEKKDVNISPTIYLEEFFSQYQKGRSLEEILKKIDHFYHEVRYEESLDVEAIQNYANLKDKVMFKLINKEKNQALLETVPYVEYQDLVLVFYVLLDIRKGGSATITVTNAMMKQWGVEVKDLYELAQMNGRRLLPATLIPIQEVIDELVNIYCAEDENTPEEAEVVDEMYVLSNEIRSLGAAVIAYDHVLEMIAEELKSGFYLIPSSIHEMIVIVESENTYRKAIDETIVEVNETQVEPDEILSNHAYYYDRVSKTLYF